VSTDYSRTIGEVREAVKQVAPEGSIVYVVSRGDPDLVQLERHGGRHFPEDESGKYAGYHPSDSEEAVAMLREAIERGADCLVIPGSAFWWLGRYPGFQEELESLGGRIWSSELCIVYALSRAFESARVQEVGDAPASRTSTARNHPAQDITPEIIEARRPTLPPLLLERYEVDSQLGRILVAGIYLADRPNSVVDIAARLAEVSAWDVEQRWIALGGGPPTEAIANLTARVVRRPTPKYELLNAVLAEDELDDYEYVIVADDDIVVPRGFLDVFIGLQSELGFALAQPARASGSFIDHPIVEQQRGCLARETLFVEIGPFMSVHRSAYELIFPFDLDSPMGWGYESVWSYELPRRGLKMGIIDAVPVDHGLREPLAYYSWREADQQRREFLAARDHRPLTECFRVLESVPFERAGAASGVS
jgi:hypothetical protein